MTKIPLLYYFTLLLFFGEVLAARDNDLGTFALRTEDGAIAGTLAEEDTANGNAQGEELATSEQNYISRNMVMQATRDTKEAKVDGRKDNNTHQVVVMPGLPGLPGMPGLPGKAEVLRSKSEKSPEFSNCRFNVSGDGRFLCNYTDVRESREPMETHTFPVVRKAEGTGIRSWDNFFRTALRNIHYRADHKHNRIPENISHQNLKNPTETDNNDQKYQKRPWRPNHQSQTNSSQNLRENETFIDTTDHEVDMIPESVDKQPNFTSILIEIDSSQTLPLPVGPESPGMYQKMSMSFDVDNYNFPYFPPWFPNGIPAIHSGSIYGIPGTPGTPGMPGTPGVAVIDAGNVISDPPIIRRSVPIISAVTRPRISTRQGRNPAVTPPRYSAPYYPFPEEQYGIPGVQSSSSFYGGVPGSLTSSRATAGIDAIPEPYIPMVPPGRPGTSVNYGNYGRLPINSQAGYPPYPYPYPYPSSYPTQQQLYPYYSGYPNPFGYFFSSRSN